MIGAQPARANPFHSLRAGPTNQPDLHSAEAIGTTSLRPEHDSLSGRFTSEAQLRTNHVPMRERLLYASENGDRWSLAREPVTGEVIVRHRANLPSGGQVSDFGLGAFLVQGGLGPEKQELLRLIGSLVDDAQDDSSGSAIS